MNTLEGIIEDINKCELVSDKVIKKVRELIGQEEWNDLYDEENDIITTTGELLITLKGIPDLEAQIEKMKCCNNCEYKNYNWGFQPICTVRENDDSDIENPVTCKCKYWKLKEK